MQNVATIEKIRAALRGLRNALETKGKEGEKYNMAFGITFTPAKGLSADKLIEAVNNNRKVSENLLYSMQAGLATIPEADLDLEAALKKLEDFEKELAALPQTIGANMAVEFTVSNEHEKEILEAAQKNITSIVEASTQDIQAVKSAKA